MEDLDILKREALPTEYSDDDQIKVGAEKLEELGRDLAARFATLRTHRERSQWEREKADAFSAYHLVEDTSKPLPYDGYPNLRCVLSRIFADSIHSHFIYSIFGQTQNATIFPHYVADEFKLRADKGAKYISYQLAYEADFYNVADDAFRKSLEYGVAYLEPRYVREHFWQTEKVKKEVTEPVVDPMTGEISEKVSTKTETRKLKKTKFDGIKIDSLPVESVYVSPYVRNLEQAVEHDAVFKLTTHRFKDVELMSKTSDKKEKPFYLPEAVKKIETLTTTRVIERRSKQEQARAEYDGFSLDYEVKAQMIELAQAHLWEDIDGDGVPENITVVFEASSGTVVRIALAPCRIVELRPYPVDERFYGESIYKMGMPLWTEFEAIHNARVAKGQWANMPFFFYRAGGRFNPQQYTLAPGQGYPVDDPGEVNFPQPAQVDFSYFNEESLILNYAERLFGISEVFQGLTPQGDKTATAVASANQRAGIRMTPVLSRIVSSLEKLIGHMWELNSDCAPKTKEYFVVGNGKGAGIFDKINREDFSVQVKFKFDIATIFDVQQMRDTWLLAFKMFRQDPMVMNHPAAAYQLFNKTVQGMGIDLEIPKPPQAEVMSPSEEHELMERGEVVEPQVGEDYDAHLARHMEWLKTEKVQEEYTPEQLQALMEHIDKTKILKTTLESSNLNKSGVFEPPMQMGNLPGMTASRNPGMMMNRMRVGETGPSRKENMMNDMRGNMNA